MITASFTANGAYELKSKLGVEKTETNELLDILTAPLAGRLGTPQQRKIDTHNVKLLSIDHHLHHNMVVLVLHLADDLFCTAPGIRLYNNSFLSHGFRFSPPRRKERRARRRNHNP
jgi:hypothetical protein